MKVILKACDMTDQVFPEVYITRYVLTKGILVGYNGRLSVDSPGMLVVPAGWYSSYWHKEHWFLSVDEAIAKAEEMRSKKIVALKKQIERLERLEFSRFTAL